MLSSPQDTRGEEVLRYVRVVAKPTVDNPNAPTLFLDAALGSDARIAGERPLFGFQGEMRRRASCSLPLALYADGTLDYGEECEDKSEQYAFCNIRDVEIAIGQLILLRFSTYEEHFRISEVIDMLHA